MDTRTVTVTIGRNVGDDPLSASSWNDYFRETRDAVEASSAALLTVAPYRGAWEGVKEDAGIFYGLGVDDDDLASLRARLETLASKYGQAAIGLSVGENELVRPFATAAPLVSTV